MSRKLQDTIEAFRKGRMGRREFFARGAAFGASTATLGYMLNHFSDGSYSHLFGTDA